MNFLARRRPRMGS